MSIYQPGEMVAGRYRIVSPLSEGGMGAVFVAEQVSLGREVALKVILPRHQGSAKLQQRFDKEARAVCRLRHPNIITYHDYGRDDAGRPFLVMEYLPGYPGTELLYGARVPALPQMIHILGQLCSALQEAHDHGIIHRDLKWSNAMVVPQAQDPLFIKLIDFGILKVATDGSTGDQRQHLTQTGVLLGTPQYMSPEAICGQPIDGRADQYSLAVMAYELITGRRPFESSERIELLRQHVQDPPPPMGDLGPGVAQLEPVLLRALAKQPGDRFPEINDLHAALAAALDLPAPARAPAKPATTRPHRARRATSRDANQRTPPARSHQGLHPTTPVAGRTDPGSFALLPTPYAGPPRGSERGTPTPAPIDTHAPATGHERGGADRELPRWLVWGLVAAAALVVGFATMLGITSALSDDGASPPVAEQRAAAPAPGGPTSTSALRDEAPPIPDAPAAGAPSAAEVASAPRGAADAGGLGDVGSASATETPTDAAAAPAPVEDASIRDAPSTPSAPAGPDNSAAPTSAPTQPKPTKTAHTSRRTLSAHRANREGRLTIVATPYADVTIDGRAAGTTPIRARAVRAGKVVVRLSHPTYGTKKRVVVVKPGATSSVMVDMR